MADDSKIQVIDFLNEVESNRRSLIANAQSKGKVISSGASLTQAVAVNNTISPSASPEKIEVRFFDADGTLLKQEFIDYGGSVTPPENPSYDHERLTFNRWGSAIGERFDNITHDVDYGAIYTINDNAYHLFCTFNDATGYTINMPVYQNVAHTITIDWGDGTANDTKTNTGTTTISHTYAQEGDYEIVVSSDMQIDHPSYYYQLPYSILDYTDYNDIINNALIKAYLPVMHQDNLRSKGNLQIVVIESFSGLSSSMRCGNLVLHDNVANITSSNTFDLVYTKMLIIDESVSFAYGISFNSIYGSIGKIIIPKNLDCNQANNIYNDFKVISLTTNSKGMKFYTAYCLKSVKYLGNSVQSLGGFNNTYSLEELIYPNNVSTIETDLMTYSKITVFTIPNNAIVNNSAFRYAYALENLVLYQDFNYSLMIDSYNLTIDCMIDMLNKVKDNTGDTSQTLTFTQDNIQIQLLNTFVVLNNGLWEQAQRDTLNAITLVEAFNSKNWTIA